MLRAFPDAPQLPAGYGLMVLVALVPPLWHRHMDPRARAWRARLAEEPVAVEEAALVA